MTVAPGFGVQAALCTWPARKDNRRALLAYEGGGVSRMIELQYTEKVLR